MKQKELSQKQLDIYAMKRYRYYCYEKTWQKLQLDIKLRKMGYVFKELDYYIINNIYRGEYVKAEEDK